MAKMYVASRWSCHLVFDVMTAFFVQHGEIGDDNIRTDKYFPAIISTQTPIIKPKISADDENTCVLSKNRVKWEINLATAMILRHLQESLPD